MKKAFLYKLTLLAVAALLSFAVAFAAAFSGTASAAAVSVTRGNVSTYFSGEYAETLKLENDNLVATVSDGDGSLGIINPLVIDDLEIVVQFPQQLKSFEIALVSDSFYANGAIKSEDVTAAFGENGDVKIDNDALNAVLAFDKVTNVLTVNAGENKIALNGTEKAVTIDEDADISIKFTVTDNVLSAVVAGETVTNTDSYYKVKTVDKSTAAISFKAFSLDGADTAEFLIVSVNQKVSDLSGEYKQTFTLNEDNTVKTDGVKPRVAIVGLSAKIQGATITPVFAREYKSVSFKVYSLFGGVSANNVYLQSDADESVISLQNKTNIKFSNTQPETVKIFSADFAEIEEYAVSAALRFDDDEAAPTYIGYLGNEDIYSSYKLLVAKAAINDYGEDGVHSIRIGETYKIPSLENLVKDNYDIYSNLKYTVYYKTPTSSSSSSSLSFTVSEAGTYEFYVVFKDAKNNAMEKDDFYIVDKNDANGVEGVEDIAAARANLADAELTSGDKVLDVYPYFPYVFTFTVEDDAPLYVTAPTFAQADAYINTRYTVTGFKIQASENNVKYTLYYNENVNAAEDDENWKLIPLKANVSEDYEENGFTYEDISAIDYDGKYTFTPIKKGAYKITCDVYSTDSVRHSDASTIVVASKTTKTVVPDNHWFRDNVWSVVFLSIGTLSLIGIIVLLFIKPKEETEKDETGEALKSRQ